LLTELGFDLQGNEKFLEFSGIGPFEAEEEILGQLLGDSGGPLHPAP
jgi:hypothetical protein